MRYQGFGIVIGLLLLVGACSSDGAQQTLVAENAALSTEINTIRGTATFQRDVLQITAEYVQSMMTQIVQQNHAIGATLQATGVDPTSIALVRSGTVVAPLATPPPQSAPGEEGAVTQTGSTPFAETAIVPTETPGEPTLYNLVMAEGVGDNDCALAAVSSFSSAAERIYIVATAANIPADTALGAQWFREGTLLVTHEFTPDFAIGQNCIWFFADQTDFPFTPGNYTVQLTINNVPAGQPVPFSVIQKSLLSQVGLIL